MPLVALISGQPRTLFYKNMVWFLSLKTKQLHLNFKWSFCRIFLGTNDLFSRTFRALFHENIQLQRDIFYIIRTFRSHMSGTFRTFRSTQARLSQAQRRVASGWAQRVHDTIKWAQRTRTIVCTRWYEHSEYMSGHTIDSEHSERSNKTTNNDEQSEECANEVRSALARSEDNILCWVQRYNNIWTIYNHD
jgi:hypothetical protein